MRTIIRRVFLFPMMFVGAWTVIWVIGWMMEGAKMATEISCVITKDVWNGTMTK